MLEFCDETQIGMIVAKVAPNLVAISLNMHGTRAVQKLIENVTDLNQVDYNKSIEILTFIDKNYNQCTCSRSCKADKRFERESCNSKMSFQTFFANESSN